MTPVFSFVSPAILMRGRFSIYSFMMLGSLQNVWRLRNTKVTRWCYVVQTKRRRHNFPFFGLINSDNACNRNFDTNSSIPLLSSSFLVPLSSSQSGGSGAYYGFVGGFPSVLYVEISCINDTWRPVGQSTLLHPPQRDVAQRTIIYRSLQVYVPVACCPRRLLSSDTPFPA